MNFLYIFFDVTSVLYLTVTLLLIPQVASNALEIRREEGEPLTGLIVMVALYSIAMIYPGLLVLGDLIVRLGF